MPSRRSGIESTLSSEGFDLIEFAEYAGSRQEVDMIALPQIGGCHCGTVRYRITAAPIVVYTCHCTDCQHFTASAFSLGVVVREETFAFQPAHNSLRVIESVADSGRIKRRYLCLNCSNWICGPPRPDPFQNDVIIRVVRGGTFDDTSWLRPTIHFWTRNKQPWIVLPDDDQRYDTQPD
jgi:hypothetical protein